MQYAYLTWSLLLLVPWLGLFLLLHDKTSRRKMLAVSLLTALLGLTEPIFVPEYWLPPTLFDLAARTGFDIESLIFSFAVGGLASTGYEGIFRRGHARIPIDDQRLPRHRYHLPILLSAPVLFGILHFTTDWNPIYTASLALFVGGIFTWYCRPDLVLPMLSTGVLFAMFYYLFFLTLVRIHPRYIALVWNLQDLSGTLLSGVPVEEILFAFSLGLLWSSVYEHVAWRAYR